jgi:hypothetical protein
MPSLPGVETGPPRPNVLLERASHAQSLTDEDLVAYVAEMEADMTKLRAEGPSQKGMLGSLFDTYTVYRGEMRARRLAS